MRIGSPATYACPSKKDRTMHRWARVMEQDRVNAELWASRSPGIKPDERCVQCLNCGLIVEGEDALDIFTQR